MVTYADFDALPLPIPQKYTAAEVQALNMEKRIKSVVTDPFVMAGAIASLILIRKHPRGPLGYLAAAGTVGLWVLRNVGFTG